MQNYRREREKKTLSVHKVQYEDMNPYAHLEFEMSVCRNSHIKINVLYKFTRKHGSLSTAIPEIPIFST